MNKKRWINLDNEIQLCSGCEISCAESKDFSDEKLLNFMFSHGVLLKSIKCYICKNPVQLKYKNAYHHSKGSTTTGHSDYKTLFYICRKSVDLVKKRNGRCYTKQALFTKSFLDKTQLSLSKIFQIASVVLCQPSPRKQFIINKFGITHETAINLFLRFREVFIVSVSKKNKKLGGQGQAIELDEARSEREKDSGKPWSWAFGAIDRSSHKTFLVPVENHNAITLKKIILERINPGTTIVTNCLQRYPAGAFNDLTVKYNINFIVPVKSDLAETIKEHWCEVLKVNPLISFNKTGHNIDHFAEYLFKSKYPDQTRRLHAFFKVAGKLYSPIK